MTDYLIVGGGLAGVSVAHVLRKHNKHFQLIDSGVGGASFAAGGVYNPMVLKRFKMVDGAAMYLDRMHAMFDEISREHKKDFRHPMPILRRLSSFEEQNEWFLASERYPQYLSDTVVRSDFAGIDAAFGYGEVYQAGWVDVIGFLQFYTELLEKENCWRKEEVTYSKFSFESGFIRYGQQTYRNVIFCEGTAVLRNPFFSYLPIVRNKGEVLNIKTTVDTNGNMIKAGVFLMPLPNGDYKVGATYNWRSPDNGPSEEGRKELMEKLETFLKCEYEVTAHFSGIRPTVPDRQPLIGKHPQIEGLYALNGLGSRGVMLAPACAELLFDFIENQADIPQEVNLSRYAARWQPMDRI